jgi:uncharacterized membrane protein
MNNDPELAAARARLRDEYNKKYSNIKAKPEKTTKKVEAKPEVKAAKEASELPLAVQIAIFLISGSAPLLAFCGVLLIQNTLPFLGIATMVWAILYAIAAWIWYREPKQQYATAGK